MHETDACTEEEKKHNWRICEDVYNVTSHSVFMDYNKSKPGRNRWAIIQRRKTNRITYKKKKTRDVRVQTHGKLSSSSSAISLANSRSCCSRSLLSCEHTRTGWASVLQQLSGQCVCGSYLGRLQVLVVGLRWKSHGLHRNSWTQLLESSPHLHSLHLFTPTHLTWHTFISHNPPQKRQLSRKLHVATGVCVCIRAGRGIDGDNYHTI